jgi:hypothetical protein
VWVKKYVLSVQQAGNYALGHILPVCAIKATGVFYMTPLPQKCSILNINLQFPEHGQSILVIPVPAIQPGSKARNYIHFLFQKW